MLKFARVWTLLALCLLLALPVMAQDATDGYTDPNGLFTAPVPPGWEDQSTEDYGLFVNDGTELYLLSFPVEADADIQQAITTGMEIIQPGFDAAPVQTSPIPIPSGTWTQNVYAFESGAIGAALGIVQGEQATLLYIVSPSVAALQANTPSLNNVLLGLEFVGAMDLSGQEAMLFDDAMAADLTAYVEDALERFNVLGASVAVVQGDSVAYLRGFGQQTLDGAPVNPETLFMIGSTTKSFTTLTLATLVDDGVIDWDTPVTDILPDFAVADPAVTEQLTVRDLVSNASGVGRNDVQLLIYEQTPTEIVESIEALPLVSPLGESFNYSNQMVATGGYAAAVAVGADLGDDVLASYFELVNERVLNPLMMDASTFDFDAAIERENVAMPYSYNPETGGYEPVSLQNERFVLPLAPAGALWSNAVDMSRYMLMQIADGVAVDGTRIVSEQNLDETQTTQISIGGVIGYGLGWFIQEYKGLRMITHGGNTVGFTSEFSFLPDAEIGVIVLANVSGANNFGAAVREYVFEQVFDLEHEADETYFEIQTNAIAQALEISENFPTESPDVEAFAPFIGEYTQGVTIAEAEGEDAESTLVLRSDFFEALPLFSSPQLDENTLTGFGLLFRFEENADGPATLTIELLADPNQNVTLERVDSE